MAPILCPRCREVRTDLDDAGHAQLCPDCECAVDHACKAADDRAPCLEALVPCLCRGRLGRLDPLPSCPTCVGTGLAYGRERLRDEADAAHQPPAWEEWRHA